MFHIVHLSDLHLSAAVLRTAPEKTPERQVLDNLRMALCKTKQDCSRPGDTWLVVITGDIFATATLRSTDVAAVTDLLWDTLSGALDQPRTLLLPGNHDVRARGFFRCGGAWPRARVIPALRAHVERALQPHVSLYARQGAALVWPLAKDEAPVDLVAYDSTYLPCGLMSAGGMVRSQDLLSLFPSVQGSRRPLVLMLHHHLIPTPVADFSLVRSWARHILKPLASNADYEEVMQTALGAGSALSTLQSLGRPLLVLHGHKHYPCVRLLSGPSFGRPAAPAEPPLADLLILSAGSAGVMEPYGGGRTSSLSIWPSFNHVQIDEQGLQAHVVAYPYHWNGRVQDLSRRLLAEAANQGHAWQPRAAREANDGGTRKAGRSLALNLSVVTIQGGTAGYADLRKSFRVERTIVAGPDERLASYREGVDCAPDAVIEPLPGAKTKLLDLPQRGVSLPVGNPAGYSVCNGLYISAGDFAAAHDKRDAPFESVELLNRYHAAQARLSVRGLLLHYALERRDCFASLMDLTLGIERPVAITWGADDSADIVVENCPPRSRLRLYWPLEGRRRSSLLRRCWLALSRPLRRPSIRT